MNLSELNDHVRQMVRESGKTKYAIAKEIGMNQSQLGRWMNSDSRVVIAAESVAIGLGYKIEVSITKIA